MNESERETSIPAERFADGPAEASVSASDERPGGGYGGGYGDGDDGRNGDRPDRPDRPGDRSDRPRDRSRDRANDRSGSRTGDRNGSRAGDRANDRSGDRPDRPRDRANDRPGSRTGDRNGDRPDRPHQPPRPHQSRRPDSRPGKDDGLPLPPDSPDVPDDIPLTQWDEDAVRLPDGIPPDADMLAGFGEAAVAAGLTRRQAQALVDWQTAFQRERARAQLDAGMATLRKAWGNKAEANQQAVLGLVSRIDRALGDESFSRALGESGAARHAGVVLGLYRIAALMAEDSLGSAAGAAAEHDETALEGLQNALHELRQARG
ncbi:hypothetical protein [uncultured Desulfovibrio sp.]|uniref:hypothetical protein n=1 Tax=uncultured Desulfovibrio sp. TaxID=167968 RepID=UPI002605AA57|nr:hypothetical protein [uncultured Desulfovibrio sp.]